MCKLNGEIKYGNYMENLWRQAIDNGIEEYNILTEIIILFSIFSSQSH